MREQGRRHDSAGPTNRYDSGRDPGQSPAHPGWLRPPFLGHGVIDGARVRAGTAQIHGLDLGEYRRPVLHVELFTKRSFLEETLALANMTVELKNAGIERV